jgi:hypothetical protein
VSTALVDGAAAKFDRIAKASASILCCDDCGGPDNTGTVPVKRLRGSRDMYCTGNLGCVKT